MTPYTGTCDPADIRSYYTSELAYLVAMRRRYVCQWCGTSPTPCSGCREQNERIEQLEKEAGDR